MEQLKYAGLRIEDFNILASAKRNGFSLQWLDSVNGVVHIKEALLQIADMEAAQTSTPPPTWNDAINAMSAEEKADLFQTWMDCANCPVCTECSRDCHTELADFLNSPYDGGKAQEGAE